MLNLNLKSAITNRILLSAAIKAIAQFIALAIFQKFEISNQRFSSSENFQKQLSPILACITFGVCFHCFAQKLVYSANFGDFSDYIIVVQ